MSEQESTLDKFIRGNNDSTDESDGDGISVGELQQLEESPVESWQLVKLGEILSLEYGDNLPSGSREDGEIPVYGSNGQVDTHSEPAVNKSGIVLGRKGSIGEIRFSDRPFWPIDTTYYITAEETNQNLRFLYYLLDNLQLERLNAASAIPGLNRNDTYGLNAIVPSFDEQRKISAVLHTVDQAIEKSQDVENQFKRIQNGLLQRLLNEGLNGVDTTQTNTRLGEIPENWEVVTIEDILADEEYAFTDGARYELSSDEIHSTGDARAILLKEVDVGEFDDSKPKFATQEKYDNLTHRAIYPGEVVIAKMADPVARACIVPDTYDQYLLGCADVVRVQTNDEFNDRFLMYCMNSHKLWSQAVSHLRGTGRSRINLENVAELKLPKPPLSEQRKIVEILRNYDDRIENEREYRERLKRLKKGLMQDLLSGTVRTTDTNITVPDEVAQHG